MAPPGTGFGSWMQNIEGGPDGMMDAINKNQASLFGKSTHEIQVDELKQEMKVLHWHKLANEAALKAALIRTKRLKEREASTKPETTVRKEKGKQPKQSLNQVSQQKLEKIAWMKRIIQDEQRKPLEVNEEYIRAFAEQERFEQQRHEQSMERHISNLRNMKSNLKQREVIGRRNRTYKQKKKILDNFITSSRDGKTVSNKEQQFKDATNSGDLSFPQIQNLKTSSSDLPNGSGLNKVIHSLDKLVELERRICSLESIDDNTKSDTSRTRRSETQKPAQRRTRTTNTSRFGAGIGFSKSKTKASNSRPSRNTFQVKVKNHTGVKQQARKRTGNNSFLTSVPDDNRSVASRVSNRSKRSTSSRATSHSKATSIYSRSSSKSKPRKRVPVGKRKLLNSKTKVGGGSSSKLRPRAPRSVASNTSTKGTQKPKSNKEHLQQFHDIRRQFEKKKHDYTRNIHENPVLKRKPVVSKVRLRQQRKVQERTRRVSRGRKSQSSTSSTTRGRSVTSTRGRSLSSSRKGVGATNRSGRSKTRSHATSKTKAIDQLGVYGTVVKGTSVRSGAQRSGKPTLRNAAGKAPGLPAVIKGSRFR